MSDTLVKIDDGSHVVANLMHRHNIGAPCAACEIERLREELKQARRDLDKAYERSALKCEAQKSPFNWASESADIYHAQNHMIDRCAAAIRSTKKEP